MDQEASQRLGSDVGEEPPGLKVQSKSQSITSQLCLGCLAVLRLVLKHLTLFPAGFSPAYLDSFRDSCSAFILWVDSYDIALGGIDATVANSRPLKRLIVQTLTKIAGSIINDLLPLLGQSPVPSLAPLLSVEARKLSGQVMAANNHDDDSDNSDTSDDSLGSISPGAGKLDKTFDDVAQDLKTHMQCLIDLGPLIRSPGQTVPAAPARAAQEITVPGLSSTMFEQRLYRVGGHLVWRHPRLQGTDIFDRLARVNVKRFERVRCMTSGDLHGKGKGKAREVEAIFDFELSQMAFYGEDRGPNAAIALPKLPAQAEAGLPFECIACGQPVLALSRGAWKKHLYQDLRPWICLDPVCLRGVTPFASKQAWAEHMRDYHASMERWSLTPCLFCDSFTSRDLGESIRHLAVHLEQIALTALPPGTVSEETVSEGKEGEADQQPSRSRDETATAKFHSGIADLQRRRRTSEPGMLATPVTPVTRKPVAVEEPKTGDEPVRPGTINPTRSNFIIHRVFCQGDSPGHEAHKREIMFSDQPRLFKNDRKSAQLHGQYQIAMPLERYLSEVHPKRKPQAGFCVIRDYDCVAYHTSVDSGEPSAELAYYLTPEPDSLRADKAPAKPVAEHIATTAAFDTAIRKLRQNNPGRSYADEWKAYLKPPYLHYLHYWNDTRSGLLGYAINTDGIGNEEKAYLNAFRSYMRSTCFDENFEAMEQFKRGLVSRTHFDKLFAPYSIVVSKDDHGSPVAYALTSPPRLEGQHMMLDCFSWDFDGSSFFKRLRTLAVRWPVDGEGPIDVKQLSAFPISYEPELRTLLSERGHKFWFCRRMRVRHREDAGARGASLSTVHPSNRYIVDAATYYAEHGAEDDNSLKGDVLEADKMKDENPPEGDLEDFAVLLPRDIPAFNLHDKKWTKVPVDSLQRPMCDGGAYERLVLDKRRKDTIAAITRAHQSSAATGRQDAAVVLLHGPTGTGKTLTAATFAEYLGMPLYNLTCADLGTDPVQVEGRLKDAMRLCQLWNAVLLLDGCDMFLEQPKESDVVHNTLVSVVLNCLGQYTGIAFLTSSRVNTMEERFTSRVQLAVLYPILDFEARRKIWTNLFEGLKREQRQPLAEAGSSSDILLPNIDDLLNEVDELAEEVLNGWQIQHALKTARQLAAWRKERLASAHVREAVLMAMPFNDLLAKTHGRPVRSDTFKGPERDEEDEEEPVIVKIEPVERLALEAEPYRASSGEKKRAEIEADPRLEKSPPAYIELPDDSGFVVGGRPRVAQGRVAQEPSQRRKKRG